MILEAALVLGLTDTADRIFDVVADYVSGNAWYSTQTLGYSLLAMGKYLESLKQGENPQLAGSVILGSGGERKDFSTSREFLGPRTARNRRPPTGSDRRDRLGNRDEPRLRPPRMGGPAPQIRGRRRGRKPFPSNRVARQGRQDPGSGGGSAGGGDLAAHHRDEDGEGIAPTRGNRPHPNPALGLGTGQPQAVGGSPAPPGSAKNSRAGKNTSTSGTTGYPGSSTSGRPSEGPSSRRNTRPSRRAASPCRPPRSRPCTETTTGPCFRARPWR